MQDQEARTTATSQAEGRLKVDAGCQHRKRKCLKCTMGKIKDGKGGPKKLKSFSSLPSSFKNLNKKMKFGSAIKASKPKNLKSFLKKIK
jgi:hypothetical protein